MISTIIIGAFLLFGSLALLALALAALVAYAAAKTDREMDGP